MRKFTDEERDYARGWLARHKPRPARDLFRLLLALAVVTAVAAAVSWVLP